MLEQTQVFLYEFITFMLGLTIYVFFDQKLFEEKKRYNLLEQKYKNLEKKLLHYELMDYHKKK